MNRAVSLFRLANLGLTLCLAMVVPAGAQNITPPSIAGRLGYFEGIVSFHTQGQTQWSYAAVNYPVTSGMFFWTEPQAKAEFEIGSSIFRIDGSTEIAIVQLDAQTTQIELQQGTMNYRVVALNPGQTIEIETARGAVALTQPGTYHIDAGSPDAPTVAATLEGEARFIDEHSYVDIGAGEQAFATGNPPSYVLSPAEGNEFDNWCLARDRREQDSTTVKYVSADMTGYQDLDQYGQWQPSPEYGQVWVPQQVPAGWAPYSEGHWAYVQPWGWTWIDDQPWGFAPFHYGRWAYYDNRWAWVPGAQAQRPVYAPALVAFTGDFGEGVAVGAAAAILAGAIGWAPLGPHEAYYPPYNHDVAYVRQMNAPVLERGALNNITAQSINQPRHFGTLTNAAIASRVMPREAFASAQAVQHNASQIGPAQIASASTVASIGAVRPMPSARGARPAGPTLPQSLAPAATTPAVTAPTVTAPVLQNRPATLSPLNQPAQPNRPAEPAQAQRPSSPVLPNMSGPARITPAHEATSVIPQAVTLARETPPTSPGPAVRPTTPQYRLRQPEVVAAETSHPTVQAPAAVAPSAVQQQAASTRPVQPAHAAPRQPALATAVPVQAIATAKPAYVRTEVAHPQQSAPLHPTPSGWQRPATVPGPRGQEKRDDHAPPGAGNH